MDRTKVDDERCQLVNESADAAGGKVTSVQRLSGYLLLLVFLKPFLQKIDSAKMVFYFRSNGYTIYMGKDKYESE